MANLVKLREIPDAIIEARAEPLGHGELRWNNWRPRRIARNGSRAIMNRDEPGVSISPRRIRSNLLLQRFLNARVQGIRASVMSVSWALTDPLRHPTAPHSSRSILQGGKHGRVITPPQEALRLCASNHAVSPRRPSQPPLSGEGVMPDGHPHSAWHSLVPTRCIVCSLYYAREGPARATQAVHPAVVVLRHRRAQQQAWY